MSEKPVIWWLRRDLRLAENPALRACVEGGGPVIPVFIRDDVVDGTGTAAKWRWSEGLRHFAGVLEDRGSRLILRSGDPARVLADLAEETGAGAVHWTRLYDPDAVERDMRVKSALKDAGIGAESHGGHVLFEPWTVETKDGGFYKVYTPYWKAVRDRDLPEPEPAPRKIDAPGSWPDSETLDEWALGAGMRRGAEVVARHAMIGEKAARDRLDDFLSEQVKDYGGDRDRLDRDATSGLSEPLTYGEIGPRTVWHAARKLGSKGAEKFLSELAWRDFAWHLVYHTPRIVTDNWREEWDAFPWRDDRRLSEIRAWERGVTGIPVVDAGLREMYVTGRMHNRARMIVASYLCKHLMVHWRIGQAWFADCLIDWDPASNAMGWQWVAGSGPDASPYFRVFNPETQGEKFDPDERYRRRWLAEPYDDPSDTALSYFDAIPESWGMSADDPYPETPVVGLKEGREAALAAYEKLKG
ncbi:deoxyribodipyrimidine photo-lyase [Rhodobacterales bacterium HKCCE2091]|nr:deoxyribodipyrimidine photo-lyase [Rhodobacterales bacterium HKCCE2091]